MFDKTILAQLQLSEAQLLAIRDKALADVLAGKTVSSLSLPGMNVTYEVISTSDLLAAVAYALNPNSLITEYRGYTI